MNPRRLYIETVGCQMNVLDSEMVVASLRKRGYELTGELEQADAILFNTCSVREQSENKTYSALGRLRQFKKRNPQKIIGVLGCMAQKDQKLVFDRAPFVDLVVGPGQLHQVPELLDQIAAGAGPQMAVSLGRRDGSLDEIKRSHETFDPLRDPTMRPTPFQAYLRIQIGCDKFCTYCVVPMTRGPEQGRPPDQILDEARTLADQGCVEITLLGQTVNSYRYSSGGRTTRLSDLLVALHEIPGLRRLKFVTNYPKDMTPELLATVRDLPKVSHYLHVPAQSGSNRILQLMKRGYTVEDYREMMARIRETLPEAAVSSDFIVGFCSETDDEFRLTAELLQECRFKNSFIFKYSERRGTKAADLMPDDVPFEVKQQRNNELLALQNAISEEDNQKFLGRTVEILVEGPSKLSGNVHGEPERGAEGGDHADHDGRRAPDQDEPTRPAADESPVIQLVGRTSCDRIVVFDGTRRQIGQFLPVAVYDVSPHTLFGAVVTHELRSESLLQL